MRIMTIGASRLRRSWGMQRVYATEGAKRWLALACTSLVLAGGCNSEVAEQADANARLTTGQIQQALTGVTLNVTGPATVAPDGTITFSIAYGVNDTALTGAKLKVSMDDINGLNTPTVDDGLATDAEKDYGAGVKKMRPVTYVSATATGPANTVPAGIAAGADTGTLEWNLGNVPDGYAGTATFTMKVPLGTVHGSTVAIKAVLQTAAGNADAMSPTVRVVTAALPTLVSYQGQDLYPGRPSASISFYYDSAQASDFEWVETTITSTGTCTPTFTNVTWTASAMMGTTPVVVSQPAAGTPFSSALVVRIPRASFNGQAGLAIAYATPASCAINSKVTLAATATHLTGSPDQFTRTRSQTFNVNGPIFCPTLNWHHHRAQAGNNIGNNYAEYPAWPEYYNVDSTAAGQYFTTWFPYLGASAHNVNLDRAYALVTIPSGIAFAGVRSPNGVQWYKDCSGTAAIPTDPMFDHNDPTLSGWASVYAGSWAGPFAKNGAFTDAKAEVIAGCRLLTRKPNVAPSTAGLQTTALWRMCEAGESCFAPDGTFVRVRGTGFTWVDEDADATVDASEVRNCGQGVAHSGTTKRSVSFPSLQGLAVNSSVPAGEFAEIQFTAGNSNNASAAVAGRWIVDLYSLRNQIDLDGVLGSLNTMNATFPAANANVVGESCSDGDVVFVPPIAAACVNPGDTGCYAEWSVPPRCQPHNNMGEKGTDQNTDNIVQYPRFVLRAPVGRGVAPGTSLTFQMQVRKSDGVTPGADNVGPTTVWPATNYQVAQSVTVLPAASLVGLQTSPLFWPTNSTYTHNMFISNTGNVPLAGIYGVSQLPVTAVDGSTGTPAYGKVFVNVPAHSGSPVVEASADTSCFADPMAAAWSSVGVIQVSSRTGFQSETSTAVPAGSRCIRVRYAAGAAGLPVGQRILAATDMGTTGLANGVLLFSRVKVGVSSTLQGPVDVAPVTGADVMTTIGASPAITVTKTATVDASRAGYIKWLIRYRNRSGVAVTNAELADNLPANANFVELGSPLDAGETCLTLSGTTCVDEANPSGGRRVRFKIAALAKDDGMPDSGADEGTLEIWTVSASAAPGDMITNCGEILASTPTIVNNSKGCASVQVANLAVTKGFAGTDVIGPGGQVEYAITVTNNGTTALFPSVYDNFPSQMAFVPGSLKVDGATASNTFVTGNTVNYKHPVALAPGASLQVAFKVTLTTVPAGNTLPNVAVSSGCTSAIDNTTCAPGGVSAPALVNIDKDGDGVANTADNCPDNANSDQLNSDGAMDGGDACDTDDDNDGKLDTADNCPTVANPTQANNDGDAQGDACDTDDDNDGVLDTADNCPMVANTTQVNTDGAADGGDACDTDDDNDGKLDTADNCPLVSNADQLNTDGAADGGNACDTDDDNDGKLDTADNCPLVMNADQLNTDGDAQGDACDTDDDNDGKLDTADNCPLVSNADQKNTDGAADGGDACDTDDDNDGVLDTMDNCPTVANPSQANADGDAFGDACDLDTDNDSVPDVMDNCPLVANPTQTNSDGAADGGDACDADDDNDGVADAMDNCPVVANANQLNTDGAADGGDACDPDDDNDSVVDTGDNCPLVRNINQANNDEDANGDACDDDDDNDTVLDTMDNCVFVANTDQANADGLADGGDACDVDDDNDGLLDTSDNCPTVKNLNQANNDGDAEGDACDADDDNDGVDDALDNCPLLANPLQGNNDGDAQGDDCDTDDDNDGVLDTADNCPLVANANQADIDNNGQGDACTGDQDGDGVIDPADNCPDMSNADQANNDMDAQGDVCDLDDDNDGVGDTDDNCVFTANPEQVNTDGAADGGDVCDTDDDDDGILDLMDNCALVANSDQANADGDMEGDACDTDDDADGVLDTADNCPLVANADQLDTDANGVGDACSLDADGDGVLNMMDNCPLIANMDQANADGDSEGDACDSDDDNDGVPDTGDNCPHVPNPDQTNTDGGPTGVAPDAGDACDDDDDGDGINDTLDNCPLVPNMDQADKDGDGKGDPCDLVNGTDNDADGVADAEDNCPGARNADQKDSDKDGQGDACDAHTDTDGDGFDDGVGVAGGGCSTSGNTGTAGRAWWLVLALGALWVRRKRAGAGAATPATSRDAAAHLACANANANANATTNVAGPCLAADRAACLAADRAACLEADRAARLAADRAARLAADRAACLAADRAALPAARLRVANGLWTSVAAVAATAGVSLCAQPRRAHAEELNEARNFNVERFTLASDGRGILNVEAGTLGPRGAWNLRAWLGYANDPLTLYQTVDGARSRIGSLVERRWGGEIGGTFVVLPWLQLAVDVPLIFAQGRATTQAGIGADLGDISGAGLGDVRVHPKVALWQQGRFGVALGAELALPTASAADYRGEKGVSAHGYVALSQDAGAWRWAVNLGYFARSPKQIAALEVDDELRARVGLAVHVLPSLDLAASGSLATAANAPFGKYARNYSEVDVGPVWAMSEALTLFAAVGAGITAGYGAPDWRALGGLRLTAGDHAGPAAHADADGDGIRGAADKCPQHAEDKDGFADQDGCPDLDNDADGVVDATDKCPDAPEDQDGFADEDGCAEADNDGDGLADSDDKCPNEAEVVNGFADDDGCADVADQDGDGIADATDKCPAQAEDKDGVADEDGCPEDNDQDGLADAVDQCVNEAGPAENRGCPDKDGDGDTVVDRLDNCPTEPGAPKYQGCKAKQLATITATGIAIVDVVYFKTDRDVILAKSFKLLDNVAAVIQAHPELPRITIEGHTDDQGDDNHNLDLSQRRALAVKNYLAAKGVDAARLDAKGYGESKPIADNKKAKGRAANRRVEFKIAGVETVRSQP